MPTMNDDLLVTIARTEVQRIKGEITDDAPLDGFAEFLETAEHDLHVYHHGYGRSIRNRYELFSYSWEPDIFEGVDVSAWHPDAVSFRIMKFVHKELNKMYREIYAVEQCTL